MAVRKKSDKSADIEMNKQETRNDIVDIDLSVTQKKRFRVNGDDNRIIYLNTSDFNIITRFEQLETKIPEVMREYVKNAETDDNIGEVIKESDKKMRELVDFLFDSEVAETCSDGGNMFDLFNGEFRFEHIIKTLLTLYGENMEAETRKMKANISKFTNKFRKG